MKKHDWRERKTGPGVPLRVIFCHSHNRYFTVYPMGHVPYSRMAMLPVDAAGHPIERSEDEKADHEEAAVCWEGTWFRSSRGCVLGQAMATRALR
jgi:hypothetical protein